MTEVSEKAPYTAPKLIELGTFEQLTQATTHGLYFDGTYCTHPGEPIGPVLS